MLVAGFVFTDRFSLVLRRVNPVAIVLPAAIVAIAGEQFGVSELLRVVYVACFAGVATGCWLATRDRLWQLAMFVNATSVAVATILWFYTGVQQVVPPRALAALCGGSLCFLIATLISALKGGFGKQMRCWFADVWRVPPHDLEENTA